MQEDCTLVIKLGKWEFADMGNGGEKEIEENDIDSNGNSPQ